MCLASKAKVECDGIQIPVPGSGLAQACLTLQGFQLLLAVGSFAPLPQPSSAGALGSRVPGGPTGQLRWL